MSNAIGFTIFGYGLALVTQSDTTLIGCLLVVIGMLWVWVATPEKETFKKGDDIKKI